MPTHPGGTADTRDEMTDLEHLAAELSTLGCKTVLVNRDGQMPYLDAIRPAASALSARVYAQADYYWYSWAEVITRRDQPAAAAQTIARTLCPARR